VTAALSHAFPLFGLRLHTPRLEMRLPTDDDLALLLEAARGGVRDPARPVFDFDWDLLPSPAFEQGFMAHYWRSRADFSPARWALHLAAVRRDDGAVMGVQTLRADGFAGRLTASTGSWLGRSFHGAGYGTEMRAAALALAFDGLGAQRAESGYYPGNDASRRVSEKMGYVANGTRTASPRGEPLEASCVLVTPATWRRDLVPVRIEGLDACRRLFG
jgi:RimJ/RimL family protein N-acetyltransferase